MDAHVNEHENDDAAMGAGEGVDEQHDGGDDGGGVEKDTSACTCQASHEVHTCLPFFLTSAQCRFL